MDEFECFGRYDLIEANSYRLLLRPLGIRVIKPSALIACPREPKLVTRRNIENVNGTGTIK